AVADPRLGLVGQLLPAVADIDAEALEAEEHGSRVLHVDVNIGRGESQRRGEVAKPLVVELEHGSVVAVLEGEHGAVPPEMVLQVVAAFPVGSERRKPLDAFAAAALHLHHVSDGVRGPEIARVDLDRAAAGWLGAEIIPGFLQREATAGEYRYIARGAFRPSRHHAFDRSDHVLRAPQPEIDEMRETEGDHIMRMDGEDRLPRGDGAIELAFAPGGQRGDVAALARGDAAGQ